MKLLKHSQIDLERSFQSNQLIKLRLRKKEKGKQVYKELQTNLDSIAKYLPYCYFIINKIVQYQILLRTSWYVGLSSKQINKEINSDNRYTSIKILVALGIIDENDHYNYTGEYGKLFPKSYKISSEYISEVVEFEMDVKLNRSMDNVSNSAKESGVIDQAITSNDESMKFESSDFYPQALGQIERGFECDTLHSDQLLEEVHQSNLQVLEGITNNNGRMTIPLYHTDYQLRNLQDIKYDSIGALELLETQKAKCQINQSKIHQISDYNRIKHQIDRITTKNIYFSTGNTGRVTTIVNQIDAEYRSFIKDRHGNDLMEIDFKSSHLNHLIRVVEEDINTGVICRTLNQDLLKSELSDLKFILENQDVYNMVCIKHAKRFNKQINRDKAKELVLQNWINGAYENRKLSKWVGSIYPTITKYIHTVNREEIINGKKKRDRKPLSNRLLESEATLVNNLIVGRLAKEFPYSIGYTVFDSILIDEDHVDHLYRIMTEESDKYFGFKCQIELKENDVESKLKKKESKVPVRRKAVQPKSHIDELAELKQSFNKNSQIDLTLNKSTHYVIDESLEKLLDEICIEFQNESLRMLQTSK